MSQITIQKTQQPKRINKINLYLQKINQVDNHYQSKFSSLKISYLQEASKQIQQSLIQLKQKFQKEKKSLSTEKNTLQYYKQHLQEKNNLQPIFTEIQDKIYYNQNLIDEHSLKIILPQKGIEELNDQILNRKIKIYEKYISSLSNVLNNQNIKKYCKKEVESAVKVKSTYQKLLAQANQYFYCPEVKIKAIFEEGLLMLNQYKNIENLSISLTKDNGILSNENYHQILNDITKNKRFLRNLNLKLMDMQFSQEKCDILKKRIKNELKLLKNLTIQNYYKQCKLGVFQDFNWQPYRKSVHIFGSIW